MNGNRRTSPRPEDTRRHGMGNTGGRWGSTNVGSNRIVRSSKRQTRVLVEGKESMYPDGTQIDQPVGRQRVSGRERMRDVTQNTNGIRTTDDEDGCLR